MKNENGKLKTEKQIEAPYELPEGWKWCRLGDVAEIARGGSPRPIEKYLTTAEDGINWIKIGDTEKDGKYIFSTKEKIIKEGLSKTRYVEEGDFLLTNSMSFGRPYILKTSGCIHDGWLVIKQCTAYNQDFLYYLLSSSAVFSQFVSLAKGSTVKNLKSETVRQVILPLPPTLIEQQRIVNRIESMFAKLDEAKEKAQIVVDSFETRKAAILHQAFTGKLTAKWRAENGVSDDSWEEKTIGECCSSLKYGTSKKSESNGKVAVIRMGNLQQGEIIYDDLVFSNDEEDIKKYFLENGDVLFNRTNSPEWVGKTSIYRGNIPAIYAGYLIKLDYEKTLLIGDYLNYTLNSPNAKEYCNFVKTDGVNQSNINAQKIGAYKIPVPSLPEQQEIVRILDSVLEKERVAKEAAETVLEQIDLLKKSILARAFRGEL